MNVAFAGLFELLLVIAAAMFGVFLLVKLFMGLGWVLGRFFRGVGAVLGRLGTFVASMVQDALRIVGGVLTSAFFVPLIVANIALGRWSTANHYGRSLEGEVVGVGRAVYRVGIGNVAQLFGLGTLLEGLEQRLPDAIARAPGPDAPRHRSDAFEGYSIVGSLPSGGSGARLFLAEPSADKRAALARAGLGSPAKVVIKSFSLLDEATLPQIVRESRALESARQLGLVLEHELTSSRFHYVMPYVPGDDLSIVTRRLHDEGGSAGLGDRQLQQVVGYLGDLLQILHRFHTHGLWHKDIKPSNIIVSGGHVQLVDLGLTTPLRSAMTLTTHGTEYFRDPELVRLALRGVKVHEVDGVKFDIYGAGAVLYSLIENSFPAHGSLSQISRRCPEALRWIIRRAMAEMSQRYGSALEMLADLRALQQAKDPFAVAPAKLPSMRGQPALEEALAGVTPASFAPAFAPAAAPVAAASERPRGAQGEIAASSRRGGVRWGLVAAALLVMGFLASGFLFVVARGPSPQHRFDTWPAPVPLASQRAAVRADGPTWRGFPVAELRGRLLAPAQLLERRPMACTVLVLHDLPAERTSELAALGELLSAARFVPLGLPGGNVGWVDDDRELALLAGARAALGLSRPDDPESGARLLAWLVNQAPELGAIVWIGLDGDGEVFVGPPLARQQADAADLAALLQPDTPNAEPASAGSPLVYRIY